MSSYEVCGALCDTRDDAAKAVVGSYMYGINGFKEVAQFKTEEIMQELKSDSDWSFEVMIVGKRTIDGDRKTEDVTPSDKRLLEIIEEIIDEAKEMAND